MFGPRLSDRAYLGDLAAKAPYASDYPHIAAGVPLMCGEPEDYLEFRIGLFGLDKLNDIDGTVARLECALERATLPSGHKT